MSRKSTSRAWRRGPATSALFSLSSGQIVLSTSPSHTQTWLQVGKGYLSEHRNQNGAYKGEEELCRRCSSGVQKENPKLFVFPQKFKFSQPGAEVLSPEAHEKVLKVKTLVLDACHRQMTYFPASLSIALAGVSIQPHAPC